ncbi:hypothetical protein SAMN05216275_10585 [Streptosporangium canum]|uniref:Uncharacterized protein n=1 Tax=Streptosporangium canum TaxID=324952 RepID=A0A1I3LBP8_9ACTN|nr:hypothetical protein [Streptosporangium canum]SFI82183.1 hypothetical protein SAMN05216275_10585 [Streptosporangium canum]
MTAERGKPASEQAVKAGDKRRAKGARPTVEIVDEVYEVDLFPAFEHRSARARFRASEES